MSNTQQPTNTPPRPQVAGDLLPEEKAVLGQMKQQSQQIVLRIGSMEVEKQRFLMMLDQQEMMIQQHLQGIGKRLGIPQGAGWQVAGDKVLIINPPPEAPAPEKVGLKIVRDESPDKEEPEEAPAAAPTEEGAATPNVGGEEPPKE